MNSSSILIGIAGGTGSGKTSIANYLLKKFGSDQLIVIEQDSYYKNNSALSIDERNQQNFDHPDAIDIELFNKQLVSLLGGKSVEIPIYDFSIHNRRNQRQFVKPCRIIVIEGILTLYFESLRKLMNIKVFVDTPDNIRFTRRLSRDVKERGRTIKSVTNQYEKTVKPMYDQFVKPSRDLADIIITDGVQNKEAIDALMSNINVLL
ncbi:MAG: uridine kinase [Candidatus Marinimicrobia bacterium]|nr:uridine kinase [Candidatus Neomarinimicrobiota bacterium]|tara:strand:- start:5039 stop:5656 length:618 start_codon:yes stop_codon:yes gene_type:complete